MNKKIGFILVLLTIIVGVAGCDNYINFTNTYDVGGTATYENGKGIKNARIFNSVTNKTVYTNESGEWNVTGLSGDAKIYVAKESYDFEPDEYEVNDQEYGILFKGFKDEEATADKYNISGKISDDDGEPIGNVRLEFESDNYEYGAVYTNEDGEFEKDDLAGIVEIFPERPGYDFNPESRSASAQSKNVDFVGYFREGDYEVYEVSGEIKTNDPEGVPHMKLNFYHNYDPDTQSGDLIGTAISDSDDEAASWSKENLWGAVTIVPYGNKSLNIDDNGGIFDPKMIEITNAESGVDFLLER